nr:MAG TPA: hypothetical protein [Caudoviricetes sp.]
MGKFLTSESRIGQLAQKGLYKLLDNELYKDDDGSIYLAWRNFQTDNFTWIKSNDWDIRCSHLHDVGCKHHQVVRVKLNENQLKIARFLRTKHDKIVCENIPPKYLEVVDVSGNWINNLFYRMLRDADCPKTPKYIQYKYRAGVSLNFGWFKSGKKKIELDKIYSEVWNIG